MNSVGIYTFKQTILADYLYELYQPQLYQSKYA